jgi:hypothetical protein
MNHTLGLRQNPFDPEITGLGRIAGKPLTVDSNPDLADLICWELAGLKRTEADLRWILFEDNPAKDAPVVRDVILVIVGVQGSGRTTLARLVRQRVNDSAKAGAPVWEPFDAEFSPYKPAPPLLEIRDRLDLLKKDVTGKLSDNTGRALVLIENLPSESFDLVLKLFHELRGLSLLFIVTTEDESLLSRDLAASGPRIEVFEQPRLTAQDVRAFIAHRVPKYRRTIDLVEATPDLSMFPFAATAPENAVGGNGGSKPVRSVNTWLVKQLERRHRELIEQQNLVDVSAAELAELRARLIG